MNVFAVADFDAPAAECSVTESTRQRKARRKIDERCPASRTQIDEEAIPRWKNILFNMDFRFTDLTFLKIHLS